MPVDPHAKRLLDIIAATRSAVGRPTPDAMRQAMVDLAQVVDAKDVPVQAREDRDIPGPGGPLPICIYTPAGQTAEALPALIYFHGGTGVFCSVATSRRPVPPAREREWLSRDLGGLPARS